jgi:hypothetical protein
LPFNYQGTATVASVSANYCWSPTVQLVAGYEYTRGDNFFDVPPSTTPDPADWSQLGSFSDVRVDTHRMTLGADWQVRCNATTFARYILFDYDDQSTDYNTGTAHMAMAGFTLLH